MFVPIFDRPDGIACLVFVNGDALQEHNYVSFIHIE
jgi:hypothetical protein